MRHHHRHREQDLRGQSNDVFLLIVLVLAGYGAWKFLPPLHDRWTIEQVTKKYVKRLRPRTRPVVIQDQIYELLDSAGIDLDTVEVEIDTEVRRGSTSRRAALLMLIDVTVHFSAVVTHPLGYKTILKFEATFTKDFDDGF